MFSAIVPLKSHVSCSTMPVFERSSSRVMAGDIDAVEGDASLVDLVEAHQEIDESRLAGTRRPDDRHGLRRDRPRVTAPR